MNDEIKEIIDCLELAVDSESYKILLNYITNLQQEIEKLNDDKRGMLVQLYKANDEKDKIKQENERLKENNSNMQEEMARIWEKCDDYKSRCEKANNQLKIIMQILKEQPNRSIKDDEWIENRLIGVVNILKMEVIISSL